MNERQKIQQAVLVLAETQGKQMSSASLKLFTDALGDISAKQVEVAILEHLRGPSGRFFPSPGDLLTHIHQFQTVPQAANECVSRVIEAVSRFGYVDPEGAKAFLGPLVWGALPGAVGWKEFCSSDESQRGVQRAQLRDRVAAALQRENPTGQVCLPPAKQPEFRALVPWPEDSESVSTEVSALVNSISIKTIKNGGTENE